MNAPAQDMFKVNNLTTITTNALELSIWPTGIVFPEIKPRNKMSLYNQNLFV